MDTFFSLLHASAFLCKRILFLEEVLRSRFKLKRTVKLKLTTGPFNFDRISSEIQWIYNSGLKLQIKAQVPSDFRTACKDASFCIGKRKVVYVASVTEFRLVSLAYKKLFKSNLVSSASLNGILYEQQCCFLLMADLLYSSDAPLKRQCDA